MQTFETEHYILHYGANAPAERDIEKIAAQQESCFSHICAVLSLTPDFKPAGEYAGRHGAGIWKDSGRAERRF